jgi:hypothetical protein
MIRIAITAEAMLPGSWLEGRLARPPARWRRSRPVGFVRPCEPTLPDRPPRRTRLAARDQV